MTSIRVLLVSDSYPPLIGGATRATQILARDLVARGHEVCVATSYQSGAPTTERDSHGVVVRRLHGVVTRLHRLSANPYRRIPPPFPDPETTLRFRRLLRAFEPDVIHAYGWLTYSCAAALGAGGPPLIVSARDYGNVCPIRTLVRHGTICDGPQWGKCMECSRTEYSPAKTVMAVTGVLGGRRLLARHVRGVHSVSRYVENVMRRHLLPPRSEATADLAWGIVPDYRSGEDQPPDESVLARLPKEPFILFVGALRRIKGIAELALAHSRIEGAPPLVLIGTMAPDTADLLSPQAHVLTDVSHGTVMAAWRRALFGVAPSTLPEPLGNVIHEAMSRSRPVIGTFPGGHSDMITDGRDGLLVPAGDVDALEAAMRWMIDNPQRREEMGRAAPKSAARFTSEVALPAMEDLFQRARERPARA